MTKESKDKLWGGRFTQPTDKFVEEFTASIQFDKRLYHQDIRGSIAHARMLGKQGIIPMKDVEDIIHGLQEILVQIAKEPLGTKGARITSHVALPGRYFP